VVYALGMDWVWWVGWFVEVWDGEGGDVILMCGVRGEPWVLL
jgi:hypothetical protein